MQHSPLSQELARIMGEESASSGLTLNQILERTEGRGIFLVMILLCLPFAPFFSIPGSSTLLGTAILWLAARHALGQPAHLPRRIGDRTLKPKTRKAILVGGLKILRFLEKGVRPRGTSWMTWRAARVVNSLVIVWMGFLLALPLAIPFTNTLPAYAIIFVAASMMEEDGVMIWMGYAASLGTTIYFGWCAELIAKHFHQWFHALMNWLQHLT